MFELSELIIDIVDHTFFQSNINSSTDDDKLLLSKASIGMNVSQRRRRRNYQIISIRMYSALYEYAIVVWEQWYEDTTRYSKRKGEEEKTSVSIKKKKKGRTRERRTRMHHPIKPKRKLVFSLLLLSSIDSSWLITAQKLINYAHIWIIEFLPGIMGDGFVIVQIGLW